MDEIVAYHEAGHVLMAVLLGGEVRLVTIEPDNEDGPDRQGDTQVAWPRSRMTPQEFAEISVQVSLAGPVAEMLYTGDPYHPGLIAEWAADWQEAWDAATALYSDQRKLLAYLEQQSINLCHRLKRDVAWACLASIADHLLAHATLEGEQVEEIVREWLA